MQKPVLISLVLCSMMLFIGCDGSSIGPILEMEADEYDFGVIRTDGISEAKFKIFNRGDKALKLYEVVTSCTCTTGEFLEKSIPPGGESVLIIRLNPNKMRGITTRLPLGLKTNDPVNGIAKLLVKAQVEYPIQFITEMEHVTKMAILPITFGSIRGTVGHRTIPQGTPTEIRIRAIQNRNKNIDIQDFLNTSKVFDNGRIDITAKIGAASPETWADEEIKEFDMVFTFIPDVLPGEYQVELDMFTNIRRYMSFNISFNFTVVKASDFSEPAVPVAKPTDSQVDRLPILDVPLHIVSIIKEPESSYAVRIATESSERWYNEGAEFNGYVLEKIYSVQNSIVVREIETGRRLRVTGKDDETSTVTEIP